MSVTAVRQLPRLKRAIDPAFKRKHPLHWHSACIIAGTDVCVQSTFEGDWDLSGSGDTATWVAQAGLTDMRFPTRTAALEAYMANAAVCPPPPATFFRDSEVQLTRVRAGEHRTSDGYRVIAADGRWITYDPEGLSAAEDFSLSHARRSIALHRVRVQEQTP